jgi:hypothetical protein
MNKVFEAAKHVFRETAAVLLHQIGSVFVFFHAPVCVCVKTYLLCVCTSQTAILHQSILLQSGSKSAPCVWTRFDTYAACWDGCTTNAECVRVLLLHSCLKFLKSKSSTSHFLKVWVAFVAVLNRTNVLARARVRASQFCVEIGRAHV